VKTVKKPLLTLMVLTLFTCSAFGIQTVTAAYTSNGDAFPLVSPITITSPSNTTYNNSELTLTVTFVSLLGPDSADLTYSIDGKNNASLPLTGTREPREATITYENGTTVIANTTLNVPYTIKGETALPTLPEGQHNITVYAKYAANQMVAFDKNAIHFTITANTEETLPELPSWAILPLFMTAPIIGVIYRNKMKKN
jgi:hypothetical protein